MPHNYERPKVAVDSFIHMFRDNVKISHKGYKMIVQKNKRIHCIIFLRNQKYVISAKF